MGAPRHTTDPVLFPFWETPRLPLPELKPVVHALLPPTPSGPSQALQAHQPAPRALQCWSEAHMQAGPAGQPCLPTHSHRLPPCPPAHLQLPAALGQGPPLPASPSPPVLGGRVPKPALSDTPTQNVLPSQPKPARFPSQSPRNRGAGPSWFTEGRATGKGGCAEGEGAGVPKKPGPRVTKMGEVRSHPGRDRLGSQRLRVPRREGSGNQEGQLEWGLGSQDAGGSTKKCGIKGHQIKSWDHQGAQNTGSPGKEGSGRHQWGEGSPRRAIRNGWGVTPEGGNKVHDPRRRCVGHRGMRVQGSG